MGLREGARVKHPSRPVTRSRCITCERAFIAHRADAHYCSGRCRQRANRARHTSADIDQQIEATRRLYWDLVRLKAEARGVSVSQILTDEAQDVDEQGHVFMHGRHVGTTTPPRAGWSTWGLEAAGQPFSPPPYNRAPIDGTRRRQLRLDDERSER
jgi:hypothetical protein